MSLTMPLSVRLKTSKRDLHVTREVSDLTFGTVSPGGYDTATITLHRPLAFTPAEVAQFGRLYIYDGRTGSTVWEGRLQDPGRTAGGEGEVYQLQAVGGQAHLQDDTRPLYLIDTEHERWDQIDKVTPGSLVEKIADLNDTGVPVILLRIPMGTAVNPTDPSRCVIAHRGFATAGQKIARVSYNYDCGLTSASLTHSLYAATQGVGAADIAASTTFSTTSSAFARVLGTNWTVGRNLPIIRFHYTGAAAPSGPSADTWWLQVSGIVARATMYDKSGGEITNPVFYAGDTMLASDVVADTLGRFLTSTIDTAGATIYTTSYAIDQIAYPDGANPLKILGDMLAVEQAYTWHVWASNPDNGKFSFEWVPWPTTVRYEADVADGFQASASGNTIYNQARVRWHNRGTIHVSLRTLANTMLTSAGFDRSHYIDLGDEASTQANAHRVGDQFLTEHQVPTNAGRLTVARPILDIAAGRMIQPWEIRAGQLIRVKGAESYPDALNNNGRDGLTVFKVAATSYSTADGTATLDLDTFAPTVARALAAVKKRPPARRR